MKLSLSESHPREVYLPTLQSLDEVGGEEVYSIYESLWLLIALIPVGKRRVANYERIMSTRLFSWPDQSRTRFCITKVIGGQHVPFDYPLGFGRRHARSVASHLFEQSLHVEFEVVRGIPLLIVISYLCDSST